MDVVSDSVSLGAFAVIGAMNGFLVAPIILFPSVICNRTRDLVVTEAATLRIPTVEQASSSAGPTPLALSHETVPAVTSDVLPEPPFSTSR